MSFHACNTSCPDRSIYPRRTARRACHAYVEVEGARIDFENHAAESITGDLMEKAW
jgi:hypothetical protein